MSSINRHAGNWYFVLYFVLSTCFFFLWLVVTKASLFFFLWSHCCLIEFCLKDGYRHFQSCVTGRNNKRWSLKIWMAGPISSSCSLPKLSARANIASLPVSELPFSVFRRSRALCMRSHTHSTVLQLFKGMLLSFWQWRNKKRILCVPNWCCRLPKTHLLTSPLVVSQLCTSAAAIAV